MITNRAEILFVSMRMMTLGRFHLCVRRPLNRLSKSHRNSAARSLLIINLLKDYQHPCCFTIGHAQIGTVAHYSLKLFGLGGEFTAVVIIWKIRIQFARLLFAFSRNQFAKRCEHAIDKHPCLCICAFWHMQK